MSNHVKSQLRQRCDPIEMETSSGWEKYPFPKKTKEEKLHKFSRFHRFFCFFSEIRGALPVFC